ncbi:molybdopterin synthase catalytic subunit [Nocardioides zeae]|uniref:Molybdopterin synthase catalytic subunit n=1 Tax=Nocardioides zeae TaxID=1457234 RepID=A0ACC6IH25_9ACTN|nr:molybdenum cofactor biosynthesis protein MoaE [Nocardioides zeae]MDR6173033.1 molybdopterin synthase catalytic subunit [Nocardioides zeae]MDR6210026.1 molybdopterin synthase catalytic subunit [Nocardioides zeae]
MTTPAATNASPGDPGEPGGPGDPGDVVRLVAVRDAALSVDEVLAALDHPAAGGVDLFIGRVRDHDGGQEVGALDYTAHPGALTALHEVCAEVAEEFDVKALAVVHRTGALVVGDLAVVLGTAAAHRGVAFDATRALIDRLKARVPIWKHQQYADGSDSWVGTP